MHALIPQSSRFGLAQLLASAAFSGVRTHVRHVFPDLRKSGRSAKNCPQERSKISQLQDTSREFAASCRELRATRAWCHCRSAVGRRTARFVSAREAELLHLRHDCFDRNEEKPSIGSAAMSSRLPDR
jgi:hypothetical protein